MQLTNTTTFPASWTLGLRPDGRELAVVVAKATFRLPSRGEAPSIADEQVPLVDADVFAGDPGFSAPVHEADYAPRKPRCDVLLSGKAYAPGGKPATRAEVELRVGNLAKRFAVVGARHWVKSIVGFTASRSRSFVELPISYGTAFGGRDTSHPDPGKHRWYPSNHAGVGFHANLAEEAVQGKPLPSTEEIGRPIEQPDGRYAPMAFGPVGRAWQPRAALAGTYDQRWLDEHFPFLPPDFDERYYQAAPVDQQTPYLRGGEKVVLVNLSRQGVLAFALPRIDLPITFYPVAGEQERVQAVCDTLFLEPDEGRFTMTWRAARPLRRDVFELAEAVVGKQSRARELARETAKEYYPSLGALVRARAQAPEEEEEQPAPEGDEDETGSVAGDAEVGP